MEASWAGTLILFGAGLVAGIMNVMAAAGSTITLPILLFLGLDAGMANGTNRVALAVQNITANVSFYRDGVSRFSESLRYGLWTIPGAIAGAILAIRISDRWFVIILGVVMIGVVASMLVPRGDPSSRTGAKHPVWINLSLLGIGFYGGFIQAGIGFLLTAMFYHLAQASLLRATVNKIGVVLVYTVPALCIFAATGNVNWVMGFTLAAGNASGAWLGARLAVRKGEGIIRRVMVIAVLVLALKLLGVF